MSMVARCCKLLAVFFLISLSDPKKCQPGFMLSDQAEMMPQKHLMKFL